MEAASVVWSYSLVSIILVSLVWLIGLGFIAVSEGKLKQIIFVMVSLAVGGLFGDAFIHLLPESFQDPKANWKPLSIFWRALLRSSFWKSFFSGDISTFSNPTMAFVLWGMNLLADGVHNLIDGMIIFRYPWDDYLAPGRF